MNATILTNYTGDFAEGDPTGEDSRAAMTFHPLATARHTPARVLSDQSTASWQALNAPSPVG